VPARWGAGLRGKPLTTTYPVENARRRIPVGARDADKLYRAALRHSRQVRLLRIGVPAALAAALLLTVAANYMPTVGGLRLPGELGKLVINGTKVTMQAPRLTGFTADSRPYEFIANSAEQDITQPDLMALNQIQAKIELEDKSMVNLTANSGGYNMKTELLTLVDAIHVVSSNGYEARLKEATVDVHSGTIISDKPVWVKLTGAVIDGQKLEVRDSGNVIRFSGGVRMVVQPNQIHDQTSDQ
jgi:lipopolysaccharide export system protein LptC